MKKRNWLLNIFLVLTVLVCLIAFLAHSRNWIRKDGAQLGILSGFYYTELAYDAILSVSWTNEVPRLPREHGFSGGPIEKGIYVDSLNPDRPVRVYIDDWSGAKILILKKDSSRVYINLPDSLKTDALYQYLEQQLEKDTNKSKRNP